jgi:hypothetical protein
MKKGQTIKYQNWDYKIVNRFGDIIHVRPCNGNGRVRMFSPTISLVKNNGSFERLKSF